MAMACMSTAAWKVTLQELLSNDLLTAIGAAGGPVVWACLSLGFLRCHACFGQPANDYRYLQQLYMALSGPLPGMTIFPFKLLNQQRCQMSVSNAVLNANTYNMTSPIARKRALVVDDSETILHVVCSLLEHNDVVEIAARAVSGRQAIEIVPRLRPDLVLLDADMPGMSGLRTTLFLSQVHPRLRIILMSMDTGTNFREACARCGASAVIYKPKFLRQLSALLQRPLLRSRFAVPVLEREGCKGEDLKRPL